MWPGFHGDRGQPHRGQSLLVASILLATQWPPLQSCRWFLHWPRSRGPHGGAGHGQVSNAALCAAPGAGSDGGLRCPHPPPCPVAKSSGVQAAVPLPLIPAEQKGLP